MNGLCRNKDGRGGGWLEGAGTKGRSWEGMRWVEKGWRMGWEVSIFLSTNLVLT